MNTLTQKSGEGGTPTPTAEKPAVEAPAWENPLIPNKKLRTLYIAMAELRLLESSLALSSFGAARGSASRTRSRKSAPLNNPGEEGCRASTILCLEARDIVSDIGPRLSSLFLRGTKLADILFHAQAAKQRRRTPAPAAAGQFPTLPDTADRLHFALGAAAAVKLTGSAKSSLVAAYLYAADLNPSQWSTLLTFASTHTLPLLLVVLPNRDKTQGLAAPGRLALLAGTCGVPGIPVDADDPVALYRVAQESTLRVRAGGGPVLMECVPFYLTGQKAAASDPIATMQQFLLHRRIVDENWLRAIEAKFAARLKAAQAGG